MDASERRQRAGAEAAEWFVRLQTDDLSREERGRFVEWLRESQMHVAEMLRVAQVHGALAQFQRWGRVATQGVAESANVVPIGLGSDSINPSGVSARRKKVLLPLAAASAAIFIAAVVLLPVFRDQVIDTERGERREVVLADGSVVQVDPQTRLRVTFEPQSRRVFLDRGRALFRVARNPDRPFMVLADETMVRAVGTAFGVERQRQGVVVTVVEGKVAVGGVAESSTPSIPLVANQQITVKRTGVTAPVRKVDSQRELAWAEGRLIFRNDSVGKVVEEFNRYNRVQLEVSDAMLAARPVSGVFNAADPESFIAFMESAAGVQVVREGGKTVTISGR